MKLSFPPWKASSVPDYIISLATVLHLLYNAILYRTCLPVCLSVRPFPSIIYDKFSCCMSCFVCLTIIGDPISMDLNRQREWDEAVRLYFYNQDTELLLHGMSYLCKYKKRECVSHYRIS